MYKGATDKSAASAHCAARSTPTAKNVERNFFIAPFLPAFSKLIQSQSTHIYGAATVVALGYLWLTVGRHRKVGLAIRVDD